jgi:UDP-N-acetylmuramoyl-tripeptide--D-alanyl-D-alanine ligase
LQASACDIKVTTPKGVFAVLLSAPGLINVMNALAATATAIAMDISLKSIQQGLQNYGGVVDRLQHLKGVNGALVINDCYNANPTSMKAAIDVLVAKKGKKILVLGDMGELGDKAEEYHAEIGAYAQAAGIDILLTLGTLSIGMTNTFNKNAGASRPQTATHYLTPQSLADDLLKLMNSGSNVLVKGSRSMAMERIVNEIYIDDSKQREKGAH